MPSSSVPLSQKPSREPNRFRAQHVSAELWNKTDRLLDPCLLPWEDKDTPTPVGAPFPNKTLFLLDSSLHLVMRGKPLPGGESLFGPSIQAAGEPGVSWELAANPTMSRVFLVTPT